MVTYENLMAIMSDAGPNQATRTRFKQSLFQAACNKPQPQSDAYITEFMREYRRIASNGGLNMTEQPKGHRKNGTWAVFHHPDIPSREKAFFMIHKLAEGKFDVHIKRERWNALFDGFQPIHDWLLNKYGGLGYSLKDKGKSVALSLAVPSLKLECPIAEQRTVAEKCVATIEPYLEDLAKLVQKHVAARLA